MVLPSIISLSRMLRYYHDYYSYWFFLLYCSVISRTFLNFSTLSGFIFPALRAFLLAFTQLSISCSSIRCFDGFHLLVSINFTTSLYLAIHFSSCVIIVISYQSSQTTLSTVLYLGDTKQYSYPQSFFSQSRRLNHTFSSMS